MKRETNRGTILVAGREAGVVDHLGRYFSRRGYRLTTISDNRQVLEFIQKLPPDLIILSSLQRPEHAFSVCVQLRAHGQKELQHIPLILVLPQEDEELITRAYAAGCDDYVVPRPQWQGQVYRIEHLLAQRRLLTGMQEQAVDLQLAGMNAEAAVAARSEFFANISHELKTPLHGILSYARFGLKRIDKAPRKKIREYLQEIEDCGNVLLVLLEDLLELAKLEAGKVEYSFQPRSIVDEVAIVVDELSHLAEENDITVQKRIPQLPVHVLLDRIWMGRVLRILLVNAIQFSNAGDVVRVEMAPQMTGGTAGVEIAVIDAGAAIPAKELDKVFDPFRSTGTGRSESYGTMMGLAICRRIVQDHQGTIYAGRKGNGKTFFAVTLPIL